MITRQDNDNKYKERGMLIKWYDTRSLIHNITLEFLSPPQVWAIHQTLSIDYTHKK